MPNIEAVCERLDKYTAGLSTQFRTLAVGLLAFSGGLILSAVTGSDKAPKVPIWLLSRLFFIAVGALLSLTFDLAQYATMYWYLRSVQKALDQEISKAQIISGLKDRNTIEKDYDEGDFRFVAARVLFWLKQAVLVVAVSWLTIDAYTLLRQSR